MIQTTTEYKNAITAPVRRIVAKVELFGSTLATFTKDDRLISAEIQRTGKNSKFFGFGYAQRLNFHLIDTNRELTINANDRVICSIGAQDSEDSYYIDFPEFYVSEVHRDEVTNELSVTCYDKIYQATEHTESELVLPQVKKMYHYAEAIGNVLGLEVIGISGDLFMDFAVGNFDGTEDLRTVLDAIAEATQTIYFINYLNQLEFKQLSKDGASVFTIGKEDYIDLDSGENKRLQTICHTTELGDNAEAHTSLIGTTQYIRDNPFWELRNDIDTILSTAISNIGNITINQFECEWRGNPALELGDKIKIKDKNNQNILTFLLNETLTFDGGLSSSIEWSYEEDEGTEANPATLGEVLKKTYAKVDKVNEQIELVTENVKAYVTKDDFQIAIQKIDDEGVKQVNTGTGFTFNDEGLTIEKTDSEMKTNINEDGMSIYRNNTEVLTVDNNGVKALNLEATTYFIIGENSRFEDYVNKQNKKRTGCFWIGG